MNNRAHNTPVKFLMNSPMNHWSQLTSTRPLTAPQHYNLSINTTDLPTMPIGWVIKIWYLKGHKFKAPSASSWLRSGFQHLKWASDIVKLSYLIDLYVRISYQEFRLPVHHSFAKGVMNRSNLTETAWPTLQKFQSMHSTPLWYVCIKFSYLLFTFTNSSMFACLRTFSFLLYFKFVLNTSNHLQSMI